jgi:hypothetical protein
MHILVEANQFIPQDNLNAFYNDVKDNSINVKGGLQRIQTNDGYTHPLNVRQGLPYIQMHPYTDDEWDTLPHVFWTSDATWDPSVLDHDITDGEEWVDALEIPQESPHTNLFDEFGTYLGRVQAQSTEVFYDANNIPNPIDNTLYHCMAHLLFANEHEIHQREPDYQALCPHFSILPIDIIERTFKATTQYACLPMSTHLKTC